MGSSLTPSICSVRLSLLCFYRCDAVAKFPKGKSFSLDGLMGQKLVHFVFLFSTQVLGVSVRTRELSHFVLFETGTFYLFPTILKLTM